MDPLPLSTIAELTGGQLLGAGDALVSRISKDTRTLQPGDLYLALRGGNFDGNAFVAAAAERGAAAAMVDAEVEVPAGFPLIRVVDSLVALQKLAGAWRDRLNLRVVGVTGSSGKTSTKEFAAGVLGAGFRVNKTVGNLNNHFGLPLTILTASQSDEAAVWEMGMNHPGEIAPLAALARPDLAILTNIGVAHIEFFGNREGIAHEKADLARAVHPGGTVIIPAEDDFADYLAQQSAGRRVIRCGLTSGDVRADSLTLGDYGTSFHVHAFGASAHAQISVVGEHMVRNALLAIAAGLALGLTLDQCVAGLAESRLTGGRLEQKLIRGIRFLDDTYNANPDSMEAALRTLASVPTSDRRIAVLGRMGELGNHAIAGYQKVGAIAACTVDTLITVGPETSPLLEAARAAGLSDLYQTNDSLEAARLLRDITRTGDVVLVKGSRAAQMENVIREF